MTYIIGASSFSFFFSSENPLLITLLSLPVTGSSGLALFAVAVNKHITSFCCGFFNTSTSECLYPTRGSYEAFPLAETQIIFDRATGSTNPNDTYQSATTTSETCPLPSTESRTDIASSNVLSATRTVTQYASGTSANSRPVQQHGTLKEIALGVGLGVPLGFVVLTASGIVFVKRRRKLSGTQALAVADYNQRPDSPATRTAQIAALANNHGASELEEIQINELDGFQRVPMTRRN